MVGNVLIDNIRFLQQRMKRPQVMDERAFGGWQVYGAYLEPQGNRQQYR